MKKNIITFEAQTEHVYEVRERPIPAAKMVPDWWKDIPKYANDQNILKFDPKASVTVKQCAPTIDMLTAGYILPLWSDLYVTQQNNIPYVQWTTDEQVLSVWSVDQLSSFEIPEGYSSSAFKYYHGWNIITPPGWSTLFIHPVGYQNLPIRVIPGVVDTDILTTSINCPFFIKEGFEGVIEKGTPMVQMIPFRRDSWESVFTNPGQNKAYFESEKLFTKLYGYYASKRAKKSYK
jgi:hypothetical protein